MSGINNLLNWTTLCPEEVMLSTMVVSSRKTDRSGASIVSCIISPSMFCAPVLVNRMVGYLGYL